jgi:hypothetical protein
MNIMPLDTYQSRYHLILCDQQYRRGCQTNLWGGSNIEALNEGGWSFVLKRSLKSTWLVSRKHVYENKKITWPARTNFMLVWYATYCNWTPMLRPTELKPSNGPICERWLEITLPSLPLRERDLPPVLSQTVVCWLSICSFDVENKICRLIRKAGEASCEHSCSQ